MRVGIRAATGLVIAIAAAVGLVACSGDVSDLDKAQAQVDAKQKAVEEAETAFTDASGAFCDASETYITALDRYGDVLNDTAPTVGDVRAGGSDLAEPQEAAFDGAEAAVEAQQALVVAQEELADAQAKLEAIKSSSSAAPDDSADDDPPSSEPLAPAATVDRVEQAESEFADAQGAITDDTLLTDASEQFNSAAVALELAWLRLLVDAGCVTDEQKKDAEATVSAYTKALQQDLADAGYYKGTVDGIYGPQTVAAVEDLQKKNELPVTGAVDKATADALQAELKALGGEANQEEIASTAAVQQTLKICGYWDGPVDGKWTEELTDAVKKFQTDLGVEPTGKVDSATIAAFEKVLEGITQPDPEPSPSAEPSDAP